MLFQKNGLELAVFELAVLGRMAWTRTHACYRRAVTCHLNLNGQPERKRSQQAAELPSDS
jgi:hypothetical protein